MVDEQLIKSSVQIYLDLSSGKLAHDGFLPRVNLDKAILEQTQQFYEARSKEVMDQTNLIDYLRIADKHYEEEKSRVEHILTWDVGQSVLKTFREEMLMKPQALLLSKGDGFKDFISQSRYEDIKLLYKLYREETDCLKPIGDQFKNFIAQQG